MVRPAHRVSRTAFINRHCSRWRLECWSPQYSIQLQLRVCSEVRQSMRPVGKSSGHAVDHRPHSISKARDGMHIFTGKAAHCVHTRLKQAEMEGWRHRNQGTNCLGNSNVYWKHEVPFKTILAEPQPRPVDSRWNHRWNHSPDQ